MKFGLKKKILGSVTIFLVIYAPVEAILFKLVANDILVLAIFIFVTAVLASTLR